MSDYGDGTPPPPPPYGGGSQGGGQPYGQPYGQQPPYGAPPPSSDPYGQPPAAPYGQPPAYGQPAAPYGQPYGAAPAYNTPLAVPGNLASMGKRFGARVIDGLIGSVVVYGVAIVLIGGAATTVHTDANGQITSGGGTLVGAIVISGLVAFAFGIGYEFVMVALKGATLGKMALGIKVVREADGQVPGWGPSGLRYLIQVAGSAVCSFIGLGVIWLSPLFDNTGRQQGWHDKVAKTLVVNK